MELRLNLVCPKEAVWEIELGHRNIISRKMCHGAGGRAFDRDHARTQTYEPHLP